MKHILMPTKLDPIARETLAAKGFEVVEDPDRALPELAQTHPETEALIVRSDQVDAAILDAFPNLKLVVRAGAGYNTIDTDYARRRGVDVMNTPGANANAVAEEVFAFALAHYRHLVRAEHSTRSGLWEKKKFMGRELYGKTIGILGLGNIGQLVARRAIGFEMRALGFDPVVAAARADELGVQLVDLDTLFSESDIVTLHVPETKDTIGMVNRRILDLMKPGALLINCARAKIINEDDLRAVRRDKELGFCTDVYPADAPGEKSVTDIADIMLPHLGASTVEANRNAARRAAEQIIAYVERGVTRHVVNKGIPDDLDEAYQQLAYHIARVARHYLGAERSVRRIECSFYGTLSQHAQWFLSPIVAGISFEFDPLRNAQDAEEFLAEKGISYEVRQADANKSYGNSMTVDLLEGATTIRQVSVRGTVTEGNLMISRIGDFDKLYFQPQGHSLIVVYRDRPGVLTRITGACADADLNIEEIRTPLDRSRTRAMAVLKTNRTVDAAVVSRIRDEVDAEVAFAMSIP